MINKTIEKEMSALVDTLNKYADAYYLRDESLISDKEYDALRSLGRNGTRVRYHSL